MDEFKTVSKFAPENQPAADEYDVLNYGMWLDFEIYKVN